MIFFSDNENIMAQGFHIRRLAIIFLCVGSVLAGVSDVKAQSPASESKPAIDNDVDRALATAHSRGTIAAMAEALAASAEPGCRAQRNLSGDDFVRHAEEILRHHGRQWLALAAPRPTMQAIARSMLAAGGDQARLAAFDRLLAHPNTVAWMKAEQKYNDVLLVDQMVDRFLRYTRTVKLSIKDFSYLGTGQDRLEDLRLKIEEESEAASRAARPQLEELEKLLAPYLPAIQAKQREATEALVDDHKVFAGVESRLQLLCIAARP
jgi:hypothetical protein